MGALFQSRNCVLSLDAMGGDRAPEIVISGIQLAVQRYPRTRYLLYGDESKLKPLLRNVPAVASVCTLRHTADKVSNKDKPSQILRQGRKTSMWLAIQAVKTGEASGVVSAGNTGALMAMAKTTLRTLPGINRPAIATILPSQHGGEVVMLDLGANSGCDAQNLVEFALMGGVFARTVLGLTSPSVGLLNIGVEDVKGNDAVRSAYALLKTTSLPIKFHGFVEGNDIGAGTVDVVVTDGFTGNIALKAVEGTAKLYARFLHEAFNSSFLARLGYLLAKPALMRVKDKTDPRYYNGAMFLGLNGVCVKSHGGADDVSFANAISVAINLICHGLNEKIKQELSELKTINISSSVAVVNC